MVGIIAAGVTFGASGDTGDPTAAWERKLAKGGDTGEDDTSGRYPWLVAGCTNEGRICKAETDLDRPDGAGLTAAVTWVELTWVELPEV